jgi:transcriptional regulator with XRE-family HTH domain
MSKRPPPELQAVSVGHNIRRFRRAEKLTLRELSERSGVSIATISKIETGKISGGFATIYKIARGLRVLVTEILPAEATEGEGFVVHKRNPAEVHLTEIYEYFPQAFQLEGVLNPYMMVVHTRKVPDMRDWSIHPGEEVVFVLSGAIDLHYEGRPPRRMTEGDSACFNSGKRHAFVCAGKEPARIFSVSTRGPATRTADKLIFASRT